MEERASLRAVLSLVFGILSFEICPCLGGVLAILLGLGERSGVGRAGFILGWISLAIHAFVALLMLSFVLFGLLVSIAQHH
jgi:hypothetical protein